MYSPTAFPGFDTFLQQSVLNGFYVKDPDNGLHDCEVAGKMMHSL